jgi:hypothetical protein
MGDGETGTLLTTRYPNMTPTERPIRYWIQKNQKDPPSLTPKKRMGEMQRELRAATAISSKILWQTARGEGGEREGERDDWGVKRRRSSNKIKNGTTSFSFLFYS